MRADGGRKDNIDIVTVNIILYHSRRSQIPMIFTFK